jgi:hypothetical protein
LHIFPVTAILLFAALTDKLVEDLAEPAPIITQAMAFSMALYLASLAAMRMLHTTNSNPSRLRIAPGAMCVILCLGAVASGAVSAIPSDAGALAMLGSFAAISLIVVCIDGFGSKPRVDSLQTAELMMGSMDEEYQPVDH